MRRREKIELIGVLLDVCPGESSMTDIARAANLNFHTAKKYLCGMEKKGLLEKKGGNYEITESGLALRSGIAKMMEATDF